MSKFTTGALAISTAINFREIKKVLDYIEIDKSEIAQKAKKEYKRANIITLCIIFFIMIPLVFYTLSSLDNLSNNPKYPKGATKEVRGHISMYEDTFWYTDSSQKYEFNFSDYNIDDSFEKGEAILIYLDDNNNVISISHEVEDFSFVVKIILMYAIPIGLLLFHAIVGRKTYAKNWNLYCQWYKQEIEPYCQYPNFNEIIKTKQYYDVTVKLEDLSEGKQRLYKKYRTRKIAYYLLLLLCIVLNIYVCIKFEIPLNKWVAVIMFIYISIFYFLIHISDENMQMIKNGYYEKYFGYICRKCQTEVKIKFQEIEKYDSLPKDKNGTRIITCPKCGNDVPIYSFDSELKNYKKYLEEIK